MDKTVGGNSTRLRRGTGLGSLAIALLTLPANAGLTPLRLPVTPVPAAMNQATAAPVAGVSGAGAMAASAQAAAASLSPTLRAANATHESGIPATAPQSTAQPTTPTPTTPTPITPPPRHRTATDPLPVYKPVYPYATTPASTAQTGVLSITTLTEAITLAYKSNPKLAAERATLRSIDDRVPQARAAYGPSLDLQGSYGLTHDWNDSILGSQTNSSGWTNSASAILTDPVMTFGRNRAAESTARAQVAFYRDSLRVLESQVLLSVVSDYVAVIRDATGVSIARQNAAILEKEHDDDAARYKVREITRTDLEQVESRYAASQGALLQAEGQLASSQAQFLRDVGAPPGDLAPPDVLTVPAQTLEAAYAVADVESPVIRSAQSREKISRAEVAAARAESMPRIDFRGTAAVGVLTPYTDSLRTRRLQAEFIATVPVFDSGKRAAKVAEMRDVNDSDWLLIDQAMRDTRASVAAAWDQMAAERASLEYFITAVEASRQAYEGGRIEERAGARTTLEVLDLARDLLFVQTNYNTALANEYLARANLLAAMGRLEAPRLVPDIAAYDPKAHFRKVAHVDDLPLFTPILRTLDGVIVGPVHGDRPFRDAGVTVRPSAPMPMPPESAVRQLDPTAADIGAKAGQ